MSIIPKEISKTKKTVAKIKKSPDFKNKENKRGQKRKRISVWMDHLLRSEKRDVEIDNEEREIQRRKLEANKKKNL